ncbi:MAG: zinc ribbon domain-containing protein [Chloroflexota bacterium]
MRLCPALTSIYNPCQRRVDAALGPPRALEEAVVPVYEYRCNQCERVFERLVAWSNEASQSPCPGCGTPSKKLLSVFAAIGSGGGESGGAPMMGGGGGGCCGGSCGCAR